MLPNALSPVKSAVEKKSKLRIIRIKICRQYCGKKNFLQTWISLSDIMGLLHRRQVRITELRRCTNQFPALYRNRFILTARLLYDNLLISTISSAMSFLESPKAACLTIGSLFQKRVENDELID